MIERDRDKKVNVNNFDNIWLVCVCDSIKQNNYLYLSKGTVSDRRKFIRTYFKTI